MKVVGDPTTAPDDPSEGRQSSSFSVIFMITFFAHFLTMESFIYEKGNDGYLVTIRGDFAEMTKVDLDRQVSKYIRLEAPVDHIRSSVKKLVSQGYQLRNQLELGWQRFIEA